MSIDKLQEKIRKMKNPSMVDFSVELDKIPPHILEEENNEILGYERFCRELMDGLRNLVPAVRFNMSDLAFLVLMACSCSADLPHMPRNWITMCFWMHLSAFHETMLSLQ